jgi:hypothetical protein
MGQRGRAPEPVALRVLKGETRPSQLGKAPQPTDPPEKPTGLSPAASKEWDAVLTATATSSHIGQAHAQTLREYAELTAAINEMQPKGGKEWRELVLVSLRLRRELCLTPATGGSLSSKPTTVRKLDRFLA